MDDKLYNYYIYHYSFQKPIKLLISDDIFATQFCNLNIQNKKARIELGDPIVVLCQTETDTKILGGDVNKELEPENSVLGIFWDSKKDYSDLRMYKRYPVSCYCELREHNGKKRVCGLIKNVSTYGFGIYSSENIAANIQLEVCIFVGTRTYFLDACVVHQQLKDNSFKYGLQINYQDVLSVKEIKNFIRTYQEDCIRYVDENLLVYSNSVQFIFDINEMQDTQKKLQTIVHNFENRGRKIR